MRGGGVRRGRKSPYLEEESKVNTVVYLVG
jgi:hypothetical protein